MISHITAFVGSLVLIVVCPHLVEAQACRPAAAPARPGPTRAAAIRGTALADSVRLVAPNPELDPQGLRREVTRLHVGDPRAVEYALAFLINPYVAGWDLAYEASSLHAKLAADDAALLAFAPADGNDAGAALFLAAWAGEATPSLSYVAARYACDAAWALGRLAADPEYLTATRGGEPPSWVRERIRVLEEAHRLLGATRGKWIADTLEALNAIL